MVRTREGIYREIRLAVPERFPLLLLLLLTFLFLHPSRLTGDMTREIFSLHKQFKQIFVPGQDDYPGKSSLSAVDEKQPKYRKKFQHVNDVSSDLQPFQKRLEVRYHLPIYSLLGYQKPHFHSAQYAFLYRLTYF